MSDVPRRMAPRPSPGTQPFWDGCAAGELRMQRCRACDELYFPPRPACPRCLSDAVTWETLSGRGTLHTYLINHRAAPGFEPPYAIAVVQLAEGPRMMSNIVGVEQTPEALELDMELQVRFEE